MRKDRTFLNVEQDNDDQSGAWRLDEKRDDWGLNLKGCTSDEFSPAA
jgi:hypothetical protein